MTRAKSTCSADRIHSSKGVTLPETRPRYPRTARVTFVFPAVMPRASRSECASRIRDSGVCVVSRPLCCAGMLGAAVGLTGLAGLGRRGAGLALEPCDVLTDRLLGH